MASNWWRAGAVTVAVALAAIGCSEGRTDDASGAGESSEASGSAALAAELNRGPAVGSQLESRDIVYTGAVALRVDDVESAAAEAGELTEAAGGYVSGQASELQGDRTITLTLRVPAPDFDATMDAVAELGTVQARSVDSDDVTDQVVDLEGRLENARASADRLRELLAEAQNLENIVALEAELSQREQEIEQISGQVEVLADEVAFASLTVDLNEKDEPTVSDDLPGPLESLRAGVVTVVNGVLIVVMVVAFLLPFTPFVALGWFGWRAWRKRHPKAEPTRLGAAPPAPGGPGWAVAPPPPATPPTPVSTEPAARAAEQDADEPDN